MLAHEYAIVGHNRASVGRWLGVAAVVTAPLLTSALASFLDLSRVTSSLTQGKLALFTISVGTAYLLFYTVFNLYAWKLFNRFLPIPDLTGKWEIVGKSLDLDGNVRYNWSGVLSIAQQWDNISVEIKTENSSSSSETASVLMKPNGECKLSYSFQNHPRAGATALAKHQGFCELVFDLKAGLAEGHYFNSMGRRTFGDMALTRQTGQTGVDAEHQTLNLPKCPSQNRANVRGR